MPGVNTFSAMITTDWAKPGYLYRNRVDNLNLSDLPNLQPEELLSLTTMNELVYLVIKSSNKHVKPYTDEQWSVILARKAFQDGLRPIVK